MTRKWSAPGRPPRPHRPGYVAPRTRSQAFSTLLHAVALLLVIGLAGYLCSLAADFQSTVVGSRIEAGLIQSTFGHVLRLPLSFLRQRPSGALAKRIDQCDQVAPIVTRVLASRLRRRPSASSASAPSC